MKDLIWSYFMQLSNHMWDDEGAPPRAWYEKPRYRPENKTDIALWDEMIDFIAARKYNMLVIDVGDGIQYESHPEISAPDAWSKDFLKKKLDAIRAKGIEPIPKLNFSTSHHTWLKEYRKMVSTEKYYTVCKDLIREVCEAFGYPRLFHLGMDEELAVNQDFREMRIVRNAALWWHDIYLFFKECEKHGARPWVWSDYYWNEPGLFEKNMPKSVLQSNWFYERMKDYPEGDRNRVYIETYEKLDKLGFDQVPCCSCFTWNSNPLHTVAYGKDKLSEEHLSGYLIVPWCRTERNDEYALKNDAHRLYLARQEVYGDV